jgi:hypothetical protein
MEERKEPNKLLTLLSPNVGIHLSIEEGSRHSQSGNVVQARKVGVLETL